MIMKSIPLTQDYYSLVDDEDYELVSKQLWHVHPTHNGVLYARTKLNGYYMIFMHTMILGERNIDHIDSNGLNNQRQNLRIASSMENARHRRKVKGTSKYKGVYLLKPGVWRSLIRYNGKQYHIGCFTNEIEAAIAYDIEAKRQFGEFAILNFPENHHGELEKSFS